MGNAVSLINDRCEHPTRRHTVRSILDNPKIQDLITSITTYVRRRTEMELNRARNRSRHRSRGLRRRSWGPVPPCPTVNIRRREERGEDTCPCRGRRGTPPGWGRGRSPRRTRRFTSHFRYRFRPRRASSSSACSVSRFADNLDSGSADGEHPFDPPPRRRRHPISHRQEHFAEPMLNHHLSKDDSVFFRRPEPRRSRSEEASLSPSASVQSERRPNSRTSGWDTPGTSRGRGRYTGQSRGTRSESSDASE